MRVAPPPLSRRSWLLNSKHSPTSEMTIPQTDQRSKIIHFDILSREVGNNILWNIFPFYANISDMRQFLWLARQF